MDPFDKLDAAILEAKRKANTGGPQAEEKQELGLARQGAAFLVPVLASAGLGWFLDRTWGTAPWGLVVMLALGFGAGFVQVWRALNGYDTRAVGFQPLDKEDLDKKNDGDKT